MKCEIELLESPRPDSAPIGGNKNRNTTLKGLITLNLAAAVVDPSAQPFSQERSFTEDEQKSARNIMRQQQGNALGFGSGPSRLADTHVSPYFGDRAAAFKAGVQFLDGVSIEEKAGDFEWAEQRAAFQRIYESSAKEQGQQPEDLSTENPLANLLLEAFDAREDSFGENNPFNIDFSPYYEGYEDQIAQALEENRAFYGLDNAPAQENERGAA